LHSHTFTQLIIAALLAGGISASACIMRMLTVSGAIAAFAVGFVVFGLGGVAFAVPLLAFFLSSSILSQVGRKRKQKANSVYQKPGARDAGQVLANGLVPSLLVVGFATSQQTRMLTLIYIAAVAAVNADTWATEIGGLSSMPWLVTSLRRVEPGASGGVSLLGLTAAAMGAVFIVLTAWLAWPARSVELLWRIDAPEMIAVSWAGFLAAYADSLLGATLQGQYECKRCKLTTERENHCGIAATRIRGTRWINNDVVNFITSGVGALAAWLLLKFYAYPI
jgi:uncharacterized protein (TIGR00297 family)